MSSDWSEVARELETKLTAGDPEPIDEFGSFADLVWHDFRPREVVQILLDSRPSYRGHKRVLIAAFGAWILHPDFLPLRRNAVRLAVARHFELAERQVSDDLDKFGWAADFVHRYRLVGIKFLRDIYYPVGGIGSLTKSTAKKNQQKIILKKWRRHIHACVEVVKIYHYSYENLPYPEYRKPSLISASTLVDKVRDDLLTRSKVQLAWAHRRQSIAYLYAANSIDTSQGRTLLDEIIDSRFSGKLAKIHLPILVGRARFVADCILANAKDVVSESADAIPSVVPLQFPAADYDEPSADLLRWKLQNKRNRILP